MSEEKKIKAITLTRREKVLLELLIHEIQEVLPSKLPLPKFNWECHINEGCKDIIDKVRAVIEPWIRANDLHPEKVKSLTFK